MPANEKQAANLLLTVDEVCRALKISRSSVYKLISAGVLQRVKLGKAARITSASVYRVASGEAA